MLKKFPLVHKIQNGAYQFYPNFFDEKKSRAFFDALKNSIAWRQESMKMFGKMVLFPRLTAWYGDPGKRYTYSGLSFDPVFWTKELLELKHQIEIPANQKFNSVLLNFYRDGKDSMSWHADDEKELGVNPMIASVNFGATRTFQLRHIQTKEKISFELTNGSLLIMQGEMQHFWQHQVPKTSKMVGERINLTFRQIL